MVRERSPSRTSSGQHLSPHKQPLTPLRQPLANIKAKMQSPSANQPESHEKDQDEEGPLKAGRPAHSEFGKASPLRNPLVKKPTASIFIPRKVPLKPRAFMSSAAQHAQPGPSAGALPAEQRGFYLPGQASAPSGAQHNALAMAQEYMNQPYKRSFASHATQIAVPMNAPPVTIQPTVRPMFSSLASNRNQPYAAPPPTIDLTKDARDDDEFDPDEAIRAEGDKFGAPDPYSYVDSTQANENIKNLLEGAFDDDDDKPRIRLRSRAKKAVAEGKQKEAKGLADRLASLSVQQDEKLKAESKERAEEQDEEEEEDGSVEGLAVKLLPHQVEGIAWMINKEIGVRKGRAILPYGGILADDMGLGKTVQSVALILTNPRPAPDAKPENPKQRMPGTEVGKGTLVVAPLALIKQWEDEIKTKVTRSHALKVLVHHGPSRTKSSRELNKYDVVITTYQTLTSEHAGSDMAISGGQRIGCFGVHWYRIILDEAHSIKNRNAKSTLACCAMESWYRWCLTGTPMQNNLDELQSLIKFLRIKPYCELPSWRESITQPMKNGRGGIAIRRLQVFLKAFMKRRTKDILKKEGALSFSNPKNADKPGEEKKTTSMQIVNREVLTVECDFDESEQRFYARLQERADRRLREMVQDGQKADYIGALVLLLRLRQACNHPYLIEMAMNKDKDAMTTGTNSQSGSQTPRKGAKVDDGEMDDLAMLMGGVSVQTKACDVCQLELSATEVEEGAVRCGECQADLLMMKKSKKGRQPTTKKPVQKRKPHQLPSNSDDEGEGEWIGKDPEHHTDLGKAGGTDDEDAEDGGDTLGSVDSDRSDDNDEDVDDSPPRSRRRHPIIKDEEDDEDDDDTDSTSDSEAEIAPARVHRVSGDKSKHKPSAKIRKLLRILKTEAPEHKTIVFSQFTSMLDLIEPHLLTAGLGYARYDGSMRNDAREAALQALRTEKTTRVLLCSLKCGSLGLNLTAASRVVILEPFWNPFVEEQAIDRVHRLNQTVDVKVFRLTIRNTVEEKILELQERKRELAKAAIEGGKAVGKLSMQDIMRLFRHDAASEGEHRDLDREMREKFGGEGKLLDGPSASAHQARNLGVTAKRVVSGLKPGKEGMNREHDVYGRRW